MKSARWASECVARFEGEVSAYRLLRASCQLASWLCSPAEAWCSWAWSWSGSPVRRGATTGRRRELVIRSSGGYELDLPASSPRVPFTREPRPAGFLPAGLDLRSGKD